MTKTQFLDKIKPTKDKTKLLAWVNSLKKTKARGKMSQAITQNKHTMSQLIVFANVQFDADGNQNETADIDFGTTIKQEKTTPEVSPTHTGLVNSKKFFPISYKKGDVFMHPVFLHPYVLLENKDTYWICCTLTTDKDFKEILINCNSRIFHNSFFTKSLFTVTKPIGKFMSPYENGLQLSQVIKKLKAIFI